MHWETKKKLYVFIHQLKLFAYEAVASFLARFSCVQRNAEKMLVADEKKWDEKYFFIVVDFSRHISSVSFSHDCAGKKTSAQWTHIDLFAQTFRIYFEEKSGKWNLQKSRKKKFPYRSSTGLTLEVETRNCRYLEILIIYSVLKIRLKFDWRRMLLILKK